MSFFGTRTSASDVAMWTYAAPRKPTAPIATPPRSCPVRTTSRNAKNMERPRYPDASTRRIAHWDQKREKCRNCKHIYLKTLSLHPGYCSVDCKSNALYLADVNRTIAAVREAIQHKDKDEERPVVEPKAQEEQEPKQEQEPEQDEAESMAMPVPMPTQYGEAHTFAEYALQERLAEQQHSIEWAFSAIY